MRVLKPLLLSYFLLTLLLLQNQSFSSASVTRSTTLKLKTTVINASVIDPSKNIIVIEDAEGLSTNVSIKPSAKTLKNAKAIKLEGVLDENNNLIIDLTKAGPPNLFPKGDYIITATQGKRKLKAFITINPPTLYVAKLQIPLSSLSKDTQLKILKEQVSGNAPIPETNNNITINYQLYETDNLNTVGPTLQFPGTIDGSNITGRAILETTSDYTLKDTLIKAQLIIDNQEQIVVSAISSPQSANKMTKSIETPLNNATKVGTDIYLAAKTKTKELANENSEINPDKINLLNLYKQVTEANEPLNNLPPNTAESLASAVVANAAPTIAFELRDVILQAIESSDGQENPDISSEAFEFAAKSPSFTMLQDKELIQQEEIDMSKFHETALGLLDPTEFNIPKEEAVTLFKESNGIIPGSLTPVEPEKAILAFEEGGAPAYTIDHKKLAGNILEIKETALSLGDSVNNTFVIPPATIFNPKETALALKSAGINNATFKIASTAIVSGDYDLSSLSGFSFQVEPGVIAKQNYATANIFEPIPPEDHDFPPGTLPADGEGHAGILPRSIAEIAGEGGNILLNFNRGANATVLNNSFVAPSVSNFGKTFGSSTSSKISTFDITRDSSKINLNGNNQLLENIANYILDSLSQGGYSSGGHDSNISIFTKFIPQNNFEGTDETVSFSDIANNYSATSNTSNDNPNDFITSITTGTSGYKPPITFGGNRPQGGNNSQGSSIHNTDKPTNSASSGSKNPNDYNPQDGTTQKPNDESLQNYSNEQPSYSDTSTSSTSNTSSGSSTQSNDSTTSNTTINSNSPSSSDTWIDPYSSGTTTKSEPTSNSYTSQPSYSSPTYIAPTSGSGGYTGGSTYFH